MSLSKRIIFAAVFVVVALVIPLLLLIAFVDSSAHFSVYVLVFGIIIFASFGFILANIVSIRKNVETAMEELKIQNAAIAFKLTSVFKDNPEALDELLKQVNNPAAAEDAAPQVDTSKVSLNPADPLIMPEVTAKPEPEKKTETFGDFE